MMRPITDLDDLYYFAQVVGAGSYTAAAKSLGLQISKLSRRVARLEEERSKANAHDASQP
jgi:DNA-binding transcriptional LysR family regulator